MPLFLSVVPNTLDSLWEDLEIERPSWYPMLGQDQGEYLLEDSWDVRAAVLVIVIGV